MTNDPAARRGHLAAIGIVGVAMLAGCASTPDVTLSYRLAEWELAIAVVHTITCSTDSKTMIVDRSATAVPVFRARLTGDPEILRLRDLGSVFADSELKVEFTEDGRLKSINQSTTGQGEAVLKAAVSAAGSLAAAAMPLTMVAKAVEVRGADAKGLSQSTNTVDSKTVCDAIAARIAVATGKPVQVSLTQTATATEAKPMQRLEFASDYQSSVSTALQEAGLNLGGQYVLSWSQDRKENLQPVSAASPGGDGDRVALKLQRLRRWTLKISDVYGDLLDRLLALPADATCAGATCAEATRAEATFDVPIPKSALFGKQTFGLILAESGRIVSVTYNRGQGVANALGALGAAAGAETAFDNAKTAALKAAAELVAAHQRAAKCALTPDKC